MNPKAPIQRSTTFCLFLCILLPLIYLTPLATHPLLEPDEGRYAEIPREMLESGDFVTPKLNHVHYFEKPALLYWANAASFKLFGENEFAARFPSALAAMGGILATGLLASALFGRLCGLLAATILGTSLLYVAIGTINLTDMPLSCFLTLAMASFYADVRLGGRRYRLLFYVAMALGTLTKGLVAIVLPMGVVFWYIVLGRKWSLVRRLFYIPGILAFFGLVVPWFYLVCRENPDFFHFFFIQEHFLRYATQMHDRYEPFWYFVPILLAGTMPWTPCLFGLLGKKSALRKPETPQAKDANLFLLLWFGVVFLFFSASGSKLIPYVVPCLPPLSILMASNLERTVRANAPSRSIQGCIATN
ncbi:phospholipid carrier-dependent glycosyltransferase, partial [Synergistaceae bacterium OttesenSCG-928-I11]|nr:phospholipid carrier-dependent glycosyltransferase [Synergistaceae bacterium OttesenSCG-928-I11]